jgi:hypothetical protein
MPDAEGLLSRQEQAVIKRWLVDKDAVRACPICGRSEWLVAAARGPFCGLEARGG